MSPEPNVLQARFCIFLYDPVYVNDFLCEGFVTVL